MISLKETLSKITTKHKLPDYYNTPVEELPILKLYNNTKARLDFIAFLLGDKDFFTHYKDKTNLLVNNYLILKTKKQISEGNITYFYYDDLEFFNEKNITFNELFKNPLREDDFNFVYSNLIKNLDILNLVPVNFMNNSFFNPKKIRNKKYHDMETDKFKSTENFTKDELIMERLKNKSIESLYHFKSTSKLLLSFFEHILTSNNKITSEQVKNFKKYVKLYVNDLHFPENIENLYSTFVKKDFYQSDYMLQHFTLHFSQNFWNKYNQYHNFKVIKNSNSSILTPPFPHFAFFIDKSKKDKLQEQNYINITMSLAYNISPDFYDKNQKNLLSIIKQFNKNSEFNFDYFFQNLLSDMSMNHKFSKNNIDSVLNFAKKANNNFKLTNYSIFIYNMIKKTQDPLLMFDPKYLQLREKDNSKNFIIGKLNVNDLINLIKSENNFLDNIITPLKNNLTTIMNKGENGIAANIIFHIIQKQIESPLPFLYKEINDIYNKMNKETKDKVAAFLDTYSDNDIKYKIFLEKQKLLKYLIEDNTGNVHKKRI